MPNITDVLTRSKGFLDAFLAEWGIALIVLVVSLGSFGLGRISALEEVRTPVSIYHATEQPAPPAMPLGGQFVAARSGTVYYYPWCSGAQRIAAGNQIWFSSEAAARAAGYAPAKNCKGLSSSN